LDTRSKLRHKTTHTFAKGFVICLVGMEVGERIKTTQNILAENLKKLYLYENLG